MEQSNPRKRARGKWDTPPPEVAPVPSGVNPIVAAAQQAAQAAAAAAAQQQRAPVMPGTRLPGFHAAGQAPTPAAPPPGPAQSTAPTMSADAIARAREVAARLVQVGVGNTHIDCGLIAEITVHHTHNQSFHFLPPCTRHAKNPAAQASDQDRDVTINDAPAHVRMHLLKRPTQTDMERRTGTIINVKGRFYLPGQPQDPKEKPLHLNVRPGAHHQVRSLHAWVLGCWILQLKPWTSGHLSHMVESSSLQLSSAFCFQTKHMCMCYPRLHHLPPWMLQTEMQKAAAVQAAVAEIHAIIAGRPLPAGGCDF
eukprot:1149586-Pelagomonas_calceolata.AAC.3